MGDFFRCYNCNYRVPGSSNVEPESMECPRCGITLPPSQPIPQGVRQKEYVEPTSTLVYTGDPADAPPQPSEPSDAPDPRNVKVAHVPGEVEVEVEVEPEAEAEPEAGGEAEPEAGGEAEK